MSWPMQARRVANPWGRLLYVLWLGAAQATAEPARDALSSDAPDTQVSVSNQCLALHVRAQEQRLEGKLRDARTTLTQCVTLECPPMVKTDCTEWLAETQRALPSLVFELTNAEVNPEKVKAWIGGEKVDFAFGQTIEFDPGALEIRFEAPGYVPFLETLVVRQGEKSRWVPVHLALPPPPPTPLIAPTLPTQRTEQEPIAAPVEVSPLLSYLLAGIAVGAAGTSAYFAFSALNDKDRADATCSPLCTQQDSERIQRKLLLADVTAATAALAGGVSITLFVLDAENDRGDGAKSAGPRFNARVRGVF